MKSYQELFDCYLDANYPHPTIFDVSYSPSELKKVLDPLSYELEYYKFVENLKKLGEKNA